MYKLDYSVYAFAFFIYCIFVVMMPQYGLTYDIECWIKWAQYIHQHGLGNIYNSDCNYLPGHLIELKGYTMLFPSKNEIIQNIHYLKYFTFLFDVAGALLLSSLVQESSKQKMILMILLLNPAFIHNTVAWGQFDSVYTFFVFASFISIIHRKFFLSILLLMLGFNMKLQVIVFIPPFLLLMLFLVEKPDWIKIIKYTLILLAIQFIILFPFLIQSPKGFINVFKGLAGDYNNLSLNAANLWQLMMPGNNRWTGDWNTLYGITFKTWGLIMLSFALLIAIFPLLKLLWFKFKNQYQTITLEKLTLLFSLFPLCFFYFNTQMHERYSFSAFIFIAAFAILSGRWWLYLLFSMAYFLNNEKVMTSTKIFNYNSVVFDLNVIALLFLIIIAACVILLYRNHDRNKLHIHSSINL